MDESSVRGRLLLGFGANAYGQALNIAVQLAGVPILLYAWGSTLYGEWLILSAIPTYLSMTDLGFSQSAANDMTSLVARGERDEALRIFRSLLALVLGVVVVGGVFVTFTVYLFPLGRWMAFTDMSPAAVRWTLWLLCCEVLLRLIEGVNHAGFRSNGDYPLHVALNRTATLAQWVAVWIVALHGYGPVGAACAWLTVRFVVTPLSSGLLLKRHSWLNFSVNGARLRELRRLSKPALANISIPLAQSLNGQGVILVIGSILGPLSVVVFSTLRTLSRLVLQLVYAVSHAAEPEFAVAYGAESFNSLLALFLRVMRTALWSALAAAGLLAIGGPLILKLWTHGRVPMDGALFTLLLVSAVMSVAWYLPLILLKAANRHVRASVVYVISSAATVVFAILSLRGIHHLAAAGLAVLVTDLVMTAYTFRSAISLVGAKVGPCLLRVIDPSLFFRAA